MREVADRQGLLESDVRLVRLDLADMRIAPRLDISCLCPWSVGAGLLAGADDFSVPMESYRVAPSSFSAY